MVARGGAAAVALRRRRRIVKLDCLTRIGSFVVTLVAAGICLFPCTPVLAQSDTTLVQTAVALTASGTDDDARQGRVTLTALVSLTDGGAVPDGTIEFIDVDTNRLVGRTSAAQARITVDRLPAGPHVFRADYSGVMRYFPFVIDPSRSATVAYAVRTVPSVSLSSSQNPSLPGEVVTLLGRNGAGKTSTLKSIMGMIGKRTGSIRYENNELIRMSSDKIARLGVAFCPEERGIFSSLDVRENLMLPPTIRSGGLSLDQIFDLFPNLKERLSSQGTKLSGGEQQMLAIGRILRTGARFLMLDEPTEGLAPVIIQQIGHTISRLKSEGFTILLVEQNFRFASTVADRFYIVEHGKIIDGFANSELQANMDKLHTYLGV